MTVKRRISTYLNCWAPALLKMYRTLRRGQYQLWPPRRTYARGELHERIKERFGFNNGFFVEVGAYDGLTASNTAYLEKYYGWRGILIEALPHKAFECLRNRPAASVVHCALVADDFVGDYVEMRHLHTMSIVADGRTLIPDMNLHLERGDKYGSDVDRRARNIRFFAPAHTLSAILDKHGSPQVDLFSLDVEGYELNVLRGLDLTRHRPRAILLETWEPDKVTQFMTSAGYRLIEEYERRNYLFEAEEQIGRSTVA